MGSPYPLHYTVRWPYYYMFPSKKNHTTMPIAPIAKSYEEQVGDKSLRLLFFGDMMLTQKDRVPVLHPDVRDVLNSADLLVGNCEAPIGAHAINANAKYNLIYHMPLDFLTGIMSQLSLRPEQWILSVANNHAGDKGKEAFYASIDLFRQIKVTAVGELQPNAAPYTLISQDDLRIGIAGWTHWLNCEVFSVNEGIYRTEHAANTDWSVIKKQHKLDTLIGLPHWEYEFQHFPKRETRRLANNLIVDKEFDLLVGAHPHTLMPVEEFSRGICAYSLGNFCGLGLAWPVRLIPILEVRLGVEGEKKGKISGYKLHTFAQVNTKERMDILPLHAVEEKLREKLEKRLRVVFNG